MGNSRVTFVDSAEWTYEVAVVVMNAVLEACQVRGECSIMLTGGRSAERLYQAWALLPDFARLKNTRFFFGDERCLPSDHVESNYGLAMRTLFKYGIPSTCEVRRMTVENIDQNAAAKAYEAQLPEELDVLLLSMGEDGHIASLFPNSSTLFETDRRVVCVRAPRPPFERLTITPPVIAKARQTYVLALGKVKASVYKQARMSPQDIALLPARLVFRATWFLDFSLTE